MCSYGSLVFFFFCFGIVDSSFAETIFKSGKLQVPLVELFSSEGCSSCPPAEKWIGDLRHRSELWKDFVPVNFHVDYWNRLGWIDPHSQKEFSMRQKLYADLWQSDRVFTPAFVVNGALKETRGDLAWLKKGGPTGELEVAIPSKGKYTVKYSEPGDFTAHIALLGKGYVSKISAGENKGETLRQDFVVHKFISANLVRGKTEFSIEQKKFNPPDGFAVALWITKTNSMIPLQAVGGNL